MVVILTLGLLVGIQSGSPVGATISLGMETLQQQFFCGLIQDIAGLIPELRSGVAGCARGGVSHGNIIF
jgi:hypothetical protein